MTNRQIRELARLSAAAKDLLDSAAEKLDISARAYVRSVKVARTIADLDGSNKPSAGPYQRGPAVPLPVAPPDRVIAYVDDFRLSVCPCFGIMPLPKFKELLR